jgi:hypothetical protein
MAAVDPAWFFSTIVQATAASIGFLIAFLAAQYSSRKDKVQDNHNSLIDHLEDMEEMYQPILWQMEKQLTGVATFPSAGGGVDSAFEIDIDQDEIEDISEGFSSSLVVKMFANLKRSQKILDEIILPQPHGIKKTYLRRLNETTREMAGQLETNGPAQDFFTDSNIGTLTPKEVREKEVFPDIDGTLYPGIFPSEVSTSTAQSWNQVLKKFRQDSARAAMKAQNTELNVDFETYQIVLKQIVNLFFVGLILPLPFLFSWAPGWWPSINGWLITGVQLAFTIAVSILAIRLFRSVRTIMSLSSKIG